MKIKMIELEANAEELRSCRTISAVMADWLANMLCPNDIEEQTEEKTDEQID